MDEREILLERILSKESAVIEVVRAYEGTPNAIGSTYKLGNSRDENQSRLYATTWDESSDGGWADKE